jgi:alkylation response protein AidB-like acyl-CoA dehydrogenase
MTTNPFTDEHHLLAESFRGFLKKEVIPYVDEWEENQHCPTRIFHLMGQEGFLGLSYPVENGGSGMDFWSAVVIARELAYTNIGGLALSLFAHAYLPPPLIHALGTPEQKEKYLRPAITGEKICALGITEPGAGSDVGGIKTTAIEMDDHFQINGSKVFITNGTIADFILLACRTGEGHDLSLFLFDTETEGFSAEKLENKLGMHTSDTGALFFDNCRIPKSALLGKKGMGFYYIMSNFQEERLLGVVSGTYVAEWALTKAIRYTQEREAFGKPLARHQTVRHKLAQMAISVEACKSMMFRAVHEFLEKGSGAVGIITMAKAFACEEAIKVINDALQLHGGWGYMESYGLSRALRDTRLFTIGGGATEIMYELISRLVIDDVRYEKTRMEAR